MRQRDDSKRLAFLEATLKEVAEFGFAGTSVARIARSAGVSPGTLYIYYADKNALLEAAFFYVSDQVIGAAVASFQQGTDLKDGLRRTWHALFRLGLSRPEYFRYHDSFTHSAWMTPDIQARNEAKAAPLLDAVERGKETGLIKPVPLPLLETFMFRPIHHLVQRTRQGSFEGTDEQIDLGFNMAWDAIALA
ncbi:TetR/AcrR family transcriptional regulator [Marinobacter qingdaonensis]|uniref:TetR/AcrR family transcriptional regulator n=1 Tax=Marinobacter qingdaonensis TaxID=3108486 RepID=A0ABU5P2I4_9GAMM|nr:TetR/AcrR family transcriptional regulator [Marinobacter sp. ASW11-75]MEA1082127.1 TetR/AcrR family transcriptional regulator [Marinobacter sp. ASW11-75]